MKCCNHDCDQGERCPLHLAKPAATPLITANSDGSNPLCDSIDEFLDDTSVLLMQGIALLGFVVSALVYASLWL